MYFKDQKAKNIKVIKFKEIILHSINDQEDQ